MVDVEVSEMERETLDLLIIDPVCQFVYSIFVHHFNMMILYCGTEERDNLLAGESVV